MDLRHRFLRSSIACMAIPFLLLLLAPEAARAADECGGTITSTNLVRTCTAAHGGGTGTFGSGIIYHGTGVNPGATGVATLNVPGGSTAWTVTSGNGAGFPGNGIALDSRDGDIAGGGLALTVGGTGNANNVNIRQRTGNANSGNDNNNGIVVNNQFTGASTTAVTVHRGVTIGTSSARMMRNGIRARVWLGSGAATFINHAEIHSAFEGIDVLRGDSADTNAATTITNTGAITAGTRGIYLRYLAGDTTGGGGNTASTTTGNAKITNSGTITKHTGTGNQGAIELDYDRGHGNAEVDNRGAIIATASGVTNGYGILLRYRNRGPAPSNAEGSGAASGTAKITNTAAIESKQHAIFLENAGAGAATVTNSGGLTVQNANSSGIYLRHTGSVGAVTVENSGAITSTAIGIDVLTRNKNAVDSDAGASVTHSGGTIDVSAGGGIKATVGDDDDTAANNAGDAVIKVTGGTVESRDTTLEAANLQSGDIVIEVSDGVTLTSMNQHVIFADMPEGNVAGGVTITNAGTITGPKTGIYVRRQATATGDGAPISITNSGHIKKTGETNWRAILVEDKNAGDVTVTNSGDIGEADPKHQHGIYVEKQEGASGGVTVTNSGDVVTAGRGIWAAVNRGLAKIDVTGGSFDVDGTILEAKNLGSGNIEIDVAAGVTLTSTEQHGVFAELGSENADGAVTIDQAGTITTPKTGIFVRRRASSGAISVTNSGAIKKTGVENWMGIFVEEKGSGDVTVTNSGDIGAADARHDHGILVQGQHPENVVAGDIDVTNSGDLMAALFGIWVPVKEANRQIAIKQSGTIAARKGIYAQVGRISAEGETRAAQPLIDIAWTGGAFSHGTETAESDTAKLRAGSVAAALETNLEYVAPEMIVREGPAVGIEAQVMGWSHVAKEVAKGDDPGEIADNAAQLAAVPTGATASDNDYVKQFRAALENADLAVAAAVFEAIDSSATSLADVTDAEIVAYLQTDDDAIRTLLQNILAQGLSDKEKAVLRAVATDNSDGLTAALDDADAGFSQDYKNAVNALLDRYNVGNIRVAVNGGSITSRGDGIRAYYATPNDMNGAISVTIADGATVTGGEAGIWVANAGSTGTGAARILKQTVEVNGTVTGGTDAAVHIAGGGMVTVGATGEVHAGTSGRAILVNDPGRAIILIHGLVRGSVPQAGDDRPHAAVHLTGGGSVTVGPKGQVEANGATLAIRGDGAPTQVTVFQDPDFADGEGLLTQRGAGHAARRLGTVGGDNITEDGRAQGTRNVVVVRIAETTPDGDPTGYYLPAPLNETSGVVEPERHPDYEKLVPCPAGQELQNDECVSEENGGDRPRLPFACDMSNDLLKRCSLYEALPSVLLAMNELPTYGERMAAARNGNGGWARIDGAGGEWKAKSSTQPNMAFDYRRYGVQAGVDFVVGRDGRFGVSVRGLQGSAEMAGSGGEIELSGVGAGAHGTAFLGGGIHVDAQAMATWYDVKLTSEKFLKDGAKGLGLALGVEAGRRTDVGSRLTVTPAVGLAWSEASLSFTDRIGNRGAKVSVEDAQSLMGRAGIRVETRTENGPRLFGSIEATREFSDERTAKVSNVALKTTEAQKTGVRLGIGGEHSWGDGRYALRAAAGYAARGSGNGEFDGAVSFAYYF